MKTVASIVADHLKKWGVTHAFGIPGKPIVPLLMEIEEQGISFVLTRHEAEAGFCAGGYALKKNTLGVAIGTSGPGGTNMLTAAGQAKAFNSPTLFITGHPSVNGSGRALGQDSSFFGTDLVKMFEPVTLFSASVERSEQFPLYFRHAIEKAFTGKRGPVHLSLPFEVLLEEITPFELELPAGSPHMRSSNLEDILPMLREAKKPVLCIGKGVHASHAYEEISWFAERWQLPVMTTPGGKGTFVSAHPLSLGSFGLGGNERAHAYLEEGIDLMIVIGTKLSDMSMAGFKPHMHPARIIQFDYDPTFIGKSLPVPTLAIVGDIKTNIRALMELDAAGQQPAPLYELPASVAATGEGGAIPENATYLSAAEAVQALRSQLPQDAVLFSDDGSHSFYAIKHFDILEPGTFHFDDVFGAMGNAIGYAVGAQLALPERRVVCLTGDGCMFMHGTAVSTAVNERAPVLFFVLNNQRLDMVEKGMKHWLGKSVGAIYEHGLNVTRFAESMGATAMCCRTTEEVGAAVKQALSSRETTVIEVIVDPDEVPPILNRVE